MVFACGRYEGIDERVLEWAAEHFRVRPVSLGDYVLNGGEVAVLAMVEAVGRLVPGVVGNPESLVEESHSDGLLEYPVYTKPSDWRGRGIPEVLLSGNHAKIARHRRDEQLRRTAERRPDLILALDPETLGQGGPCHPRCARLRHQPHADPASYGEVSGAAVEATPHPLISQSGAYLPTKVGAAAPDPQTPLTSEPAPDLAGSPGLRNRHRIAPELQLRPRHVAK